MDSVFGIDVSKRTSNVAILVNSQTVKQFTIDNNAHGFNILDEQLRSFTDPLIIFEATGIYSRPVENYLDQAKYRYTKINPLRAKKDMDSFRHNKTDSLDALGLAQAMTLHHYKSVELSSPVYSELHDLERFYQERNEDIVREKNRLHRTLSITFPEVERLLSVTDGDLYWNIVQQFPSPEYVLRKREDEIAPCIMQATNKNMSIDRSMKLAIKLTDLANSSFKMTNIDCVTKETIFHTSEVQRIDHCKSDLINKMAELSENLPEIKIITSIPGIGIKTAVCLVAELGDIRRFYSSNAINAFVGIDLIHYESGDYTAGDHIRKRGAAYARKILYRAVLNIISASRTKPTNISLVYDRKKQSSGSKGSKKIVVMAMHHLIRTIYHLVLNNEMYDTKMFPAEH
ncbi:IS110 family RNA-guided transposase [Companilactobacillus mishanensis]|uniref:IS110 family transposase n=1 Tax=Companilactobacillus mishanensis TaxID=2486008 RepID=UPI0036262A07